MPMIAGDPGHPAIQSDAAYFKRHRHRRFRIRTLVPSEFGLTDDVVMFVHGHNADCAEANVVVVRRFKSHRIRVPFYCHCQGMLRDDAAIRAFLRLHEINPATMRSLHNTQAPEVSQ